jgi:hypothetical protein
LVDLALRLGELASDVAAESNVAGMAIPLTTGSWMMLPRNLLGVRPGESGTAG